MSKLYRKNLLWEGSRMMLPEHREAILKRRKEAKKITLPELDEQQLEKMFYSIQEAMYLKQPILATYAASDYQTDQFYGFVETVDVQSNRIYLKNGDLKKKIPLAKLLSLE